MSESRTLDPGSAPRDGRMFHSDLPSLEDLTDRIRDELAARGQIGLLSVSVLQTGEAEHSETWSAYESMRQEVSSFLESFLREQMRRSDDLFRPSVRGNGFVILLDHPRTDRGLDMSDIARVRLRIRNAVRGHLEHALGDRVREAFGCYVGGALMRHRPDVAVERIVFRSLEEAFADALREKEREERRNLLNLHHVLEMRQVRAVYQPVVDIVARRVIGLEALSRVPPGRFPNPEQMFKVAHENRVLWRLERLCRSRALEALPPVAPDQLLFMNIEPDSIQDPELRTSEFLTRIEAAGLQPTRIVLELTEHSAVRDFPAIRKTLNEFRSMGFRLAMDDVGSGYAGLQSIAEIAPDYIKIDMALVRDLHNQPIKRELIATIRRFSDTSGITLVAEGVECPEELDSLRKAGVRCAQGFLFARPAEGPPRLDWESIDRDRV